MLVEKHQQKSGGRGKLIPSGTRFNYGDNRSVWIYDPFAKQLNRSSRKQQDTSLNNLRNPYANIPRDLLVTDTEVLQKNKEMQDKIMEDLDRPYFLQGPDRGLLKDYLTTELAKNRHSLLAGYYFSQAPTIPNLYNGVVNWLRSHSILEPEGTGMSTGTVPIPSKIGGVGQTTNLINRGRSLFSNLSSVTNKIRGFLSGSKNTQAARRISSALNKGIKSTKLDTTLPYNISSEHPFSYLLFTPFGEKIDRVEDTFTLGRNVRLPRYEGDPFATMWGGRYMVPAGRISKTSSYPSILRYANERFMDTGFYPEGQTELLKIQPPQLIKGNNQIRLNTSPSKPFFLEYPTFEDYARANSLGLSSSKDVNFPGVDDYAFKSIFFE